MKDINELGETVATDVLIIGGGISGLLAGIKARKRGIDVLVVDKGGIGWAGQVPVSGGDCAVVRSEDAKEYFKWLLDVGEGLSNKEWTYAFATDMYDSILETAAMGLPFLKTDGELVVLPLHKNYTATQFSPRTFMIRLKTAAVKSGIKTLDKIYIIDLLRQNGKVVGAIGFGLVDCKTYIFVAKATVIANGSCRYMRQRHFSVNTGEGVAMAYRAGAQLMNAEFANTYTFGFKGDIRRRTPLYLFFENVLGDRFIGNYYPDVLEGLRTGKEFQDFYRIADAMAKEVTAGRGPIYIDFRKLTHEEKKIALRTEQFPSEIQPVGRGNLLKLIREKTGLNPEEERLEVEPQFVGGQGPIRIDLDCRTTVDGLWAAGDAASLGSGYMGARASGTFGGFGIAFAIVSGFRAGRSVGEYAANCGNVRLDYGDATQLKERMLAPLGRDASVDANDVIYQVHEAVVPVKYSLHREKGRLIEALEKVHGANQNLSRVEVKDYHELARYHQAESMALGARWTLKSALLREESRGTHYREDHPYRDDNKWLKWILIKEEHGGDSFSTQPVPLEAPKLDP